MEQLPFVIIRDDDRSIYLVNIKTCAKPKLLVKAEECWIGFCLSREQDSFDFHFTHILTEDDKSEFEMHSRFCFRSDLIKFLEENGELPPLKLNEVTTLMKEK